MADHPEQAFQYFVSFKLSKANPEYKWDPSVVEKALPIVKGQDELRHTLHLSQVILDEAAVDGELNVVEVRTKSFEGDAVTTPLAFLKAGSTYQTIINVELPDSSVTLVLKKGSGPIHVIGLHTATVLAREDEDGDDDEDGDEEEEAVDEDAETDTVTATEMETDADSEQVAAAAVPTEASNGATNGDGAHAQETVNEKKRKISDAVDAVDGGKVEQNGKANSNEEDDGAAAKKVKLVGDGEEKTAEVEQEKVAPEAVVA